MGDARILKFVAKLDRSAGGLGILDWWLAPEVKAVSSHRAFESVESDANSWQCWNWIELLDTLLVSENSGSCNEAQEKEEPRIHTSRSSTPSFSTKLSCDICHQESYTLVYAYIKI